MSGMILPAGSPLVQFEVTAHCKSGTGGPDNIPLVVWVHREPETMNCPVYGQGWRVASIEGAEMTYATHLAPGVCLCMGNFLE